MGASFIMIALSWDLETALARFPMDKCILWGCIGNCSVRGIGLLSMFLGGEFLDYAELANILPVSREMARYHAMLGSGDRGGSNSYGYHVCTLCEFIH